MQHVPPPPQSPYSHSNLEKFSVNQTPSSPSLDDFISPISISSSLSFSPDISSNDFPLDSGTKNVKNMPNVLMQPSTISEFFTPIPAGYPASVLLGSLAVVGAFGFLYAAQPKDPSKTDAGYPAGIGVKNSLIVLGCINTLGMFFTLLVPESKGKSLEEMSGENENEEEIEIGEIKSSGDGDGV